MAALADPALTTVVLVARADRVSLAEAARAAGELAALPARLTQLPAAQLPLVGADLTGIAALRALTSPAGMPSMPAPGTAPAMPLLPDLGDLAGTLAAGGPHAILVTGKGGVGKTTIAARLALALAGRGLPVHLSTTDPAGRLPHLAGAPDCLTVSRIDPEAETAKYVAARLAAARGLDRHRRALLEEELRSPCTTELAVFRAFAGLLMLARTQFVVIDTASSGHTLLLLDLTGAYHRQEMHRLGDFAAHAITPLMRLQNPAYSRVLIVTLAETTPVAEAAALQEDLRRAGVEPFGWVINASLAASTTHGPLLAQRAVLEAPHLRRITSGLAERVWLAPWDPAAMPDKQPPSRPRADRRPEEEQPHEHPDSRTDDRRRRRRVTAEQGRAALGGAVCRADQGEGARPDRLAPARDLWVHAPRFRG